MLRATPRPTNGRYTLPAGRGTGGSSGGANGGPGTLPGGGPGQGANGLKSPIIGLLDRGKAPKAAYYGVVDGYVVNVTWASLQLAPGAGIAAGNRIDQAIAQVRQANRTGAHLALKVRIFAGSQAPNWAKYLGGAPFVARDPNSGATGTVGRFWTPAFGQAYQDLERKLAARYDLVPEIREVTIARCMTIYAETMIRQISDRTTIANMLAAGYTVAADQICQQQQISAHTVWLHTRSDLAFNPYQWFSSSSAGTNEAFTEQMMSYCRSVLGMRCVLENNSLRVGSLGPGYDLMYTAMRLRGPNIAFQTATMARVGSFSGTLIKAVSLHAASIELPSGYETVGTAALAGLRVQLAANAR